LRSLSETGVYLIANPSLGKMIRGKWVNIFSSQTVVTDVSKQTTEDLVYLRDLIEAGHLKTYIDQVFPLKEMVAAHRYVESGAKKGHLIIDVTS
jgi:NADPH:quinone reductase-like Zn-dependent oxidoreductase